MRIEIEKNRKARRDSEEVRKEKQRKFTALHKTLAVHLREDKHPLSKPQLPLLSSSNLPIVDEHVVAKTPEPENKKFRLTMKRKRNLSSSTPLKSIERGDFAIVGYRDCPEPWYLGKL